jgi:hypothetical protein
MDGRTRLLLCAVAAVRRLLLATDLSDNQLIGSGPLEKLLIGCMLIAVIDSIVLLFA